MGYKVTEKNLQIMFETAAQKIMYLLSSCEKSNIFGDNTKKLIDEIRNYATAMNAAANVLITELDVLKAITFKVHGEWTNDLLIKILFEIVEKGCKFIDESKTKILELMHAYLDTKLAFFGKDYAYTEEDIKIILSFNFLGLEDFVIKMINDKETEEAAEEASVS